MGIDAHHAEIARKIEAGEPGHAQADILFDPPAEGQREIRYRVSYSSGDPGTVTHAAVIAEPAAWPDQRIREAIVIEVAAGRGKASPRTFHEDHIRHMIGDLEKFPEHRSEKHALAKLLRGFYLDGDGRALLIPA